MKKFTFLTTMLLLVALFYDAPQLRANNPKTNKQALVEVATIAELRSQEADNATEYLLTGEAILIYQQSYRNKKWIQDETAGIEIDDNGGVITTEYEIGDGITGIQGKLNVYNNLLQFLPTQNPAEATSSGNEMSFVERTLADLSADDQGRLVLINELRFDEANIGNNFATGINYNVTDPSGAGVFRTEFYEADYIGTTIPAAAQNVKVIVRQYNDVMQITARFASDFEPAEEEPTYTVTFNIIDENDATVTDAVITFNEVEYAAGVYVFEEVGTGSYEYSVEKEGYHTRSGQVVVAGVDIEVNLVLVEISGDLVDTFPWEEGFEESVPPSNWHSFSLGEGSWTTTSTVNSGSAAAFHTFVQSGEADSWLVSPQISVPAEGSMLLKFYQKNGLMADYGYSGVMISSGSGVPQQNEFTEVYESDQSINNYTQKIIDLADYAGSVIYIAFVYQGQDAHQWYIDDISVELAPEAIEVANIGELRQQEVGSIAYILTGEAIITHMHGQRNQKYIQDETGAILIDDNAGTITTEYNLYDGITGLKGTLTLYSNLLQFIPEEDPGEATSTDNVVEPIEITLSELTPDHQAMLVRILDVEFNTEETLFAPSKSYNILDPSGTGILRTPSISSGLDYFNTEIPTSPVNMTALVSQFNDDMQIFPRSLADIEEATSAGSESFGHLSVYPNPFEDYFHAVANDGIIKQIVIYNVVGQVVRRIDNANSSAIINTSQLSKGIYMVKLSNENDHHTVIKMIKR